KINREEFIAFLNQKGIPAMIYYPVPLHQQKAYLRPEFNNENFPVTVELCESVVSLPMHTELDQNQLKYITDSVLEFINL
ncbi:MAG: transcriptional regulator, partial [Flavobacteriales bacterium CG_4_9_14_3_um_filter_32_8]